MNDSAAPTYPQEWETDVVLSDGSTASVRPIRADDTVLLNDFHLRQSQESVYFRFFRYRPELSDKELAYFTTIDYDKRMAFVALVGGELVAVARYETWNSPAHPGKRIGEVAFFTDDAHHGKGLATLLLEFLAAAARRNGMDGFTATVLPANYNMLRVFRRAGFDVSTRFEDGAIEVDLGIDVTGEATAAIAARGRISQARSVQRIFEPGSVALVGASTRPGSVGNELARNLVNGGFVGHVAFVNQRATAGAELLGQALYSSILDVPGQPDDEGQEAGIDLVIIAVPAASVRQVVADCVATGAGSLVIISAGFSESGPEGKRLEAEIVELARHNGMRLVGPNSFGLINTSPEVSLRSVYVAMSASPGAVGFLSQSGPLGAAVLEHFRATGVGISTFAAMGNRADVSANDLLQYWSEDDRTRVIALYLENFGNLRNFTAIAQHVSVQKPIVAVAPNDSELAEMLEQSGLILVDYVAEMAPQCQLVLDQPLPLGDRVAIISNAASVARLSAAACRKAGLEPIVPSSVSQTEVAGAVLIGDLDSMRLTSGSSTAMYEQVVVAAAVCEEVDSILLALVPTLDMSIEQLGKLFHQVNRSVAKPIVATGLIDPELLAAPGLPVFTFPEEAARAMGRMASHARWRAQRHGKSLEADQTQVAAVAQALEKALDGKTERDLGLLDADLQIVLDALDIPLARCAHAKTSADAALCAADIGYPVVLKAGGMQQRTAGERGGVALDLQDASDVTSAFERMERAIGDDFLPAIVQKAVPTGTHLRVALHQSSGHGARLLLGIGGSSAERLPPQVRIVLPTSETALDGVLTQPWIVEAVPSSPARFAIRDVLMRLARVADATPDVAALVCNPVLVCGDEVAIVDVEVELRPWPKDPLAEVRHL